MNVIVVGGGTKGKFGNDLVNRLRSEGHDVYILSHRSNGTNDAKQAIANFNNIQNVVETFERLTNHLDTIDLFLYNSNGRSYINGEQSFTSTASFSIDRWYSSLNIVAAIPYMLIVKALSKMNENSKILYMATGLAINFNRVEHTEYAGYAGGKALMTHLMLGFAHHNDKGSIVSILSPHFDYENREHYNSVFENTYKYILNLSKEHNGTIKQIYS
jgi:NAD(P)-dependent dehydrogenase (short-subunit alcohol dehydrogenase family)